MSVGKEVREHERRKEEEEEEAALLLLGSCCKRKNNKNRLEGSCVAADAADAAEGSSLNPLDHWVDSFEGKKGKTKVILYSLVLVLFYSRIETQKIDWNRVHFADNRVFIEQWFSLSGNRGQHRVVSVVEISNHKVPIISQTVRKITFLISDLTLARVN